MSCATTCHTITRPAPNQTELWDADVFQTPRVALPNLLGYDQYVVFFSGGKDSIACFLSLVELGVARDRIELWHHEVDGRENGVRLMDWPSTPAYVSAFARAFGVKLFYSWREGGLNAKCSAITAGLRKPILKRPRGSSHAAVRVRTIHENSFRR